MFINRIKSDNVTISEEDLIKIEKEYDFKFPNDLREFYLIYNGGMPERNEVYLELEDWNATTKFHGFYAIKKNGQCPLEKILKTNYHEEWWIRWLIPFGYDEGGEDFCFSIRESDYGSIYYVSSDCIDEDNPEETLILVADSFKKFINKMK